MTGSASGPGSRRGPRYAGTPATLLLAALLVTSMVGAPNVAAQDGDAATSPTTHVLNVYVVDSRNRSIPQAEVRVLADEDPVAAGTTDAWGAFTTTVAPGTYDVRVRAGGYAGAQRTATFDGATTLLVQLNATAAPTTGMVAFDLHTRDRHTGCRVDANYTLRNTGDVPFSAGGATGPDGRATHDVPVKVHPRTGIRPTDYALHVSKPGYKPLDVNRSVDNNTIANVRLDPASGTVSVFVTARKDGIVEPAQHAVVDIRGTCPNGGAPAVPGRKAWTNERGRVTFNGLPPADYTLTMWKYGYGTVRKEVPLDAGGSATRRAHLELTQPSRINVSVEEALAFGDDREVRRALEDAEVTFRYLPGGNVWTRSTDGAGETNLTRLPPGRYVVTVEKDEETRHGATVGWESVRTTVVLGLDESEDVEVTLQRNASRIDSAAVGRESTLWIPPDQEFGLQGPLAETTFHLEHVETGTEVTVTTDEAGGFSDVLPAGAYRVWTERTVDRPTPRRIDGPASESEIPLRVHVRDGGAAKDDGGPASPARLLLDEGEEWTPSPGLVAVPQLGTMKVDLRRSAPADLYPYVHVTNATVTVTDSEGHVFRARTDMHGRAFFPRLHPGNATVEARKQGYATVTRTIHVPEWSDGRSPDQALDGDWNVTKPHIRLEPLGGTLDFTIEEYNTEDGVYDPDGGWLLVVSEDRDRLERFSTEVQDGDTIGPFPNGTYHVYLQAAVHDEAKEAATDGCHAQAHVYRRTVELGPSPATVSFRYGGGGTTTLKRPDRMPVAIFVLDYATNRPIETRGKDANVTARYTHSPDPCGDAEPRTTTYPSSPASFETDDRGRPVTRQWMEPMIHTETFLDPSARLDPTALEPPYQAFVDGFPEVTLAPGDIWGFHFRPHSARVTGTVTDNATGDPLAGVHARLGPIEETTNTSGGYALVGVPDGSYEVAFSKPGYYSETHPVTVDLPDGGDHRQVPVEGPDAALEPLPDPKVDVGDPLDGVFLNGIPMNFTWEVTLQGWPVDTDRPGGSDTIERVEWVVQTDNGTVEVETTDLELDAAELQNRGEVTLRTTLPVGNLTGDLETGEVRNLTAFYVNVTTRGQGTIRYPPKDPGRTRTAPERLVATPPWMAHTYKIVSSSEEDVREVTRNRTLDLWELTKDDVDPAPETEEELKKTAVDKEGNRLVGPSLAVVSPLLGLPRFHQSRGLAFEATKAGTSAEYVIGYKLMLDLVYPMRGPLPNATGLQYIGAPRAEINGWVNGTLDGADRRWRSDAAVGGKISVLVNSYGPNAPIVAEFVPIAGSAGVWFNQTSGGEVPGENLTYDGTTTYHGNISMALVDIIQNLLRLNPWTAAPSWLSEAVEWADVKLGLGWNLETHHQGKGPTFEDSRDPVSLNDGNGYETVDDLTIAGDVKIVGGKSGIVSVEQDPAQALTPVPGLGELANNHFPNGFTVTFEDFFTQEEFTRGLATGNLTCAFSFNRVRGALLAIDIDKVGILGFDAKAGAEAAINLIPGVDVELGSNREVEKRYPFGPYELCSGSPSEVNFTEYPTSRARLDRYWTTATGYGNVLGWSGNGTLLEAVWPYSAPSIAAGNGTVDLVVDHDPGVGPYPGSLILRRYTGTAERLREGASPDVNGAWDPAVRREDGTTSLAFTGFAPGAEGLPSLHTGEIHLAVANGTWSNPVPITDDRRLDHAVEVAAVEGGHVLAWTSDPTTHRTPGDADLRYAFVADGQVRETGRIPGPGVVGEHALAATGDGAILAYTRPASGDTRGPDVADRTAHYAVLSPGGTATERDLGGARAVDLAPLDPNRTMAVASGPDGLRYAILRDGDVVEEGRVAPERAPEVELVEAPGSRALLVWPHQGKARYALYAGSWSPPATVLDGLRASIEAAVDARTGTIFVASKRVEAPAPLRREAAHALDVDTFRLPSLQGGNRTPGNATNLTDLPLTAENLQAVLDRLPPRLRARFADATVNVRVEGDDGTREVGIRTEGGTVEEVGPPHEDPRIVVDTDRETLREVEASLAPEQALAQAIERGDVEIEGRGGAEGIALDVAERAGRIVARFQGNPLDVPPGETRRTRLGGEERTLGGTDLGYNVVLDGDGGGDGEDRAGRSPDGGAGAGGGDWPPDREDVVGDDGKPSPAARNRLPVVDRQGVPQGYTTPGVQALVNADPGDLSPDAGVYQERDPILPGAGGGDRRRTLPTAVEAGARGPGSVRDLPAHGVTVRTFTTPSRAPCGADEPGPRVVETVTGPEGALLLEGRHVDGERILLLRRVADGESAVLGACDPGGGEVRVRYTLEGRRVAETTFEQVVGGPGDGDRRVLRFTWDADAGTLEHAEGPPADPETVASRAPPTSLEAFRAWTEGSP